MELHEILIYGVAALGCFILAILIKGNRQAVLQLATDLINKAESTIQGSGMGADKAADSAVSRSGRSGNVANSATASRIFAGKSSRTTTSPSTRMLRRSMKFSNSRTLPGQG